MDDIKILALLVEVQALLINFRSFLRIEQHGTEKDGLSKFEIPSGHAG